MKSKPVSPKPEPTPAPGKSPLIPTLLASILLIAGGVTAYWFLVQRRPLSQDIPVGANIVPQDALMTLTFSTDEGQWQRLREFGTPETQAEFDQRLAELRDRLLTANGYDYQRDIQPWVGNEITVAFLPPASQVSSEAVPTNPSPTAPSNQQSVVMVLPIANQARAQELLAQPRAEGNELVEREYNGFQIWETEGDSEQNYAATVIDRRFLVVGTNTEATEQAIDTYRGEESVATTPGYREAFGQIEAPQAFSRIFVNVPVANSVASANSTQPVPPQGLAQLRDNQGLAATVTLEPDGVLFKGVTWLRPDSEKRLTVNNTATQMPNRLPADTLMMVSGGNLQQLWQDYVQGAQSSPITPVNPDNLRAGLQNTTGLNLDQDLMPWMDGEFTLALVPASQQTTEQQPASGSVGLVFMVQASDRRAAEQTFERLDDAMRSRYRFQVAQAEVDAQSVVTWTSPFNALSVTRGWMAGNIAFLSFGAPIANTLLPQPDAPLANSELFQKTASSELNPSSGHFFVDVDRVGNNRGNLPVPQLIPSNSGIINGIRALGVTAAIQDQRSTRYDIRVMLLKGNRPGPFPPPGATQPNASPTPSPEASPSLSPE